MADRRQVLRGLLAGAAGAAAPAVLVGCGVPGGGGPIVDGPGPSVGVGGPLAGGSKPPTPADAAGPDDLVKKYLLAAAGPLDDQSAQRRQDAVKKFLTPKAQLQWGPPDNRTEIPVVQLMGEPTHSEGSTSFTVYANLRQVGQLTAFGAVTPSTSQPVQCKFEVVTNPTPREAGAWRIDSISSEGNPSLATSLLLSTAALDPAQNLFSPQLVYFWSASRDVLVPDLRYVPLAGNEQNLQTWLVNDLLLGKPPDWLGVTQVPPGIKLAGPNVYTSKDGQLVVSVSAPALTNEQQHGLLVQLRASLAGVYLGQVQLQNNSQQQPGAGTGDDFNTFNLADSSGRKRGLAEFCIAGGEVRALQSTANPPPVLNSSVNSSVTWAALSRDTRMIAVVREAGAGRQALWLGSEASGPNYTQVPNLPETDFSRPVWLPGQDRVVVAANGRLFAVDWASKEATDITPSGMRVTAFSIGPDGRRIALISGGNLYLGALAAKAAAAPQQLDTTGLQPGSLSAVAWSSSARVIVAGRLSNANAYSLLQVTVDGALSQLYNTEVRLTDQITHLTAYPPPPPPTQPWQAVGKVLGEAGHNKYAFEFVTKFNKLAEIAPSPDPSPSGSPAKPLSPMNPFFAD